jgi:predicted GIY-YIG superfamily endonuclease
MSYVYLLLATPLRQATYVGATVDLDRRLRQHNKEIKGGATATGIRVAKGDTWIRAAHVTGFPDWQAALQFEWRWKQLSRKLPANMDPLLRRMKALKQLLELERPTTKAKAYSEWETSPEIIFGDDMAKDIFNNLTE